MKKIITLFIVFISFCVNAQNQFTETFTKFAKITDGKLETIQKGNATIVFNYGENNNIKIYYANGNSQLYSRVSGIKEEVTKDGTKYEYSKVLDEKGEELYLAKYEDGEIRLLYLNSFNGTKGYGIALYP